LATRLALRPHERTRQHRFRPPPPDHRSRPPTISSGSRPPSPATIPKRALPD